jgi:hypothetical protein
MAHQNLSTILSTLSTQDVGSYQDPSVASPEVLHPNILPKRAKAIQSKPKQAKASQSKPKQANASQGSFNALAGSFNALAGSFNAYGSIFAFNGAFSAC